MVTQYSAMIKMDTMDLSASDLMIFLKIMWQKNQKLNYLLMYCLRLEKLDQNLPEGIDLTGQLYGKRIAVQEIGIVEVLD